MRRPPPPRERVIQADIVRALGLALAPGVRVVASLNGVLLRKGGLEWARLRQQGAYAGFPDLQVLSPTGLILFFEVKRRGSKLEESQVDWFDWFAVHGYHYYVVHDAEEAVQRCRDHGLLREGVRFT